MSSYQEEDNNNFWNQTFLGIPVWLLLLILAIVVIWWLFSENYFADLGLPATARRYNMGNTDYSVLTVSPVDGRISQMLR